jgi:hypothetical protein
MVDYAGYQVPNDANFEHRSNIKAEPASPDRVREIVREQQAFDEKMRADEIRKMAERAEAAQKRLEVERVQDAVRHTAQRLTVSLWAVPCKNWDEGQLELYAKISNWLEERA